MVGSAKGLAEEACSLQSWSKAEFWLRFLSLCPALRRKNLDSDQVFRLGMSHQPHTVSFQHNDRLMSR